MKKLICCVMIASFFVSCTYSEDSISKNKNSISCPDIFGVWISYSELGDFYASKQGFKKAFKSAVKECKDLGANTLFVHVRANADAFYPSKIFPYSNTLETEPDYDLLAFMIDTAHQYSMQFHAWINPYRISNTTSDYKKLNKQNPAYKWLSDDDKSNDTFVIKGDNDTLFFNPSVSSVKKLILDGVKEIIDNYDVDGIHFDDYFYLSNDETIDEKQYVEYLTNSNAYPLDLYSWRRANVTELISAAHRLTLQKGILFGVSPAANMQYNFDTVYADVETWLKTKAVDYIMPQIYFGFEYPDKRYTFNAYLKEWKTLCENYSPTLYIGLAPYKCNTLVKAESEWTKDFAIISKQMKKIDNDSYLKGYVLFSYSHLFSTNKSNIQQLNYIKQYLNEKI
ncbi:MAG: family 10 glycosylhydrolase [Acutalibacteraceae bacterium]|nr:family 10 glycosylhydrolase [Acutalibacteraceae bacterium]